MSGERLAYSAEIDGLRAVAVLGVVLFHMGLPGVGGGFAGVDVFFVISGYLITSLLLVERSASGRIAIGDFYARRMRRLLPALLLVVTATVVGACLVLSVSLGEVQSTAESAVASLALLSNVLFFRETGDYFGRPAEHLPLLHIWSLSVEEQFYLFWPLFVAALLSFRRRGAWIGIGIFSAASWLGALWMTGVQPQAAFYLTPFRGWEFGVGAAVALRGAGDLSPRVRAHLANVGLAAIVVALSATRPNRWFPALGAIASTLGTGVLLLSLAGGSLDTNVGRILRWRPIVAIGRLSYSWYLWHWPPMALYAAMSVDGGTLPGRTAIGVASLGMAALTVRWVEQPFRRRRVGESWSASRTVIWGGAASGLAILLFTSLAFVARSMARSSPLNTLLAERTFSRECMLETNATALPSLDSVCVRGMPDAAVALLWGDSHALAWEPFAEIVAASRGLALVQMTASGCPPVAGEYEIFDGQFPVFERLCHEQNRRALRAIASRTFRGRRIATVILAQRWSTTVRRPFSALDIPQYDLRSAGPRAASRSNTLEGIATTVAAIDSRIEVLYLAPLPELRNTTSFCLARSLEAECAMPRVVYDSLRADVLPFLYGSLRGRRGGVVDPADYFCDDARCPVRRHEMLLYFDDDHITAKAARGFATEWLRTAGVSPPASLSVDSTSRARPRTPFHGSVFVSPCTTRWRRRVGRRATPCGWRTAE